MRINSTPKCCPWDQRTLAKPTERGGEVPGSSSFISKYDPNCGTLLLTIAQPGTETFKTVPSPIKESWAKITGRFVAILVQ
jgi:hypothetical protein